LRDWGERGALDEGKTVQARRERVTIDKNDKTKM
jgi:hypothetical protein